MAKITRPCPNCQFPLAIPQPMPERFMCPKCKVVMKAKSSAGAPPAAIMSGPPRVAAPTPIAAGPPRPIPMPAVPGTKRARGSRMLLYLGGFVLLMVGGIVVLVVMIVSDLFTDHHDSGKKKPEETVQGNPESDPNKKKLPRRGPREPDKRVDNVKQNVARGVAFLQERLREKSSPDFKDVRPWDPNWQSGFNHSPSGVVSLIGLTLLECGVAADDPDILWAAKFVESEAPNVKQVHLLSINVLFLCRWQEARGKPPEDEKYRRVLQTLALRLIAGQMDFGGWWYDAPILNAAAEKKLLSDLNDKDNPFKPNRKGDYTASNTHFAIQALWAAHRFGIPVRQALLAAAGHFHRTQAPDGSWSYSRDQTNRRVTATCTGLLALAMEKGILGSDPRPFVPGSKTADPDKAFAFIAKSIGERNKEAHEYAGFLFGADAHGDIYYLWSVQQLAEIYDLDTIKGKDLYGWGQPIIIKAQQDDGRWNDKHGPLVDTCFALLFLKQSNLAKDLTEKLR